MKRLTTLLAALTLYGTAWGAPLNGTSFDPDVHKAIFCLTFDDWVTTALADSLEDHGIPTTFFIAEIFESDARNAAAQAARLQGHEIGGHGAYGVSIDSLWHDAKYDSVAYEFTRCKTWVDSLIQVIDPDFDCVDYANSHGTATVETDSVGFQTYDVLRHRFHPTDLEPNLYLGGSYFVPWRLQTRVWHYGYFSGGAHDTTEFWIEDTASVASDDTTSTRSSANRYLNYIKSIHGLGMLVAHPSADSMDGLGQDQWSIFMDVFDSDNLTDVWVTTVDSAYKAIGPYLRGYGRTDPWNAYQDYGECYYDSARTADDYEFGLGTETDPWGFEVEDVAGGYNTWGLGANGKDEISSYYKANFTFGAGAFPLDTTWFVRIPCKITGQGHDNTFITVADSHTDDLRAGIRTRTNFYWGWEDVQVEVSDVTVDNLTSAYARGLVLKAPRNIVHGCSLTASGSTYANAVYVENTSGRLDMVHLYNNIFVTKAVSDGSAIKLKSGAARPDSLIVNNNVFHCTDDAGMDIDQLSNYFIYNNVFIPTGASDEAIWVIDTIGYADAFISNNLVSTETYTVADPFRLNAEYLTPAEWAVRISDTGWESTNGNGTFFIDEFMAAPYTDIASESDTLKWGGCQTWGYPIRNYGFSSYGFTQWPHLPTIPGRFATIADSDSLNAILSWCWAEGDTVQLDELPSGMLPDNTDMNLWLNVPHSDVHYRGGWN
jgi:peptidoglycan/xylan/chitin deacetylase (PgdA/CDA1 family)